MNFLCTYGSFGSETAKCNWISSFSHRTLHPDSNLFLCIKRIAREEEVWISKVEFASNGIAVHFNWTHWDRERATGCGFFLFEMFRSIFMPALNRKNFQSLWIFHNRLRSSCFFIDLRSNVINQLKYASRILYDFVWFTVMNITSITHSLFIFCFFFFFVFVLLLLFLRNK